MTDRKLSAVLVSNPVTTLGDDDPIYAVNGSVSSAITAKNLFLDRGGINKTTSVHVTPKALYEWVRDSQSFLFTPIHDQSFLRMAASLDEDGSAVAGSANEALLFISSTIPSTVSSTVGYAKAAMFIAIEQEDTLNGLVRDGVTIDARSTIPSGNLDGGIFTIGANARIRSGGDGRCTAAELSVSNESGIDVKETGGGDERKALNLVSLIGSATVAMKIGVNTGAGGTGFYQGIDCLQSALINDPLTRFINYQDLFEVARDGTLTIGKGTGSVGTTGIALLPTGGGHFSANGAAAQFILHRNDAPAAPFDTSNVTFQGIDDGAGNTIYGRMIASAQDKTAAAEQGRLRFQITNAGSLSTMFDLVGNKMAFFGAAAVVKPTITGSRGSNVALASLLTELATLGLITDSTT